MRLYEVVSGAKLVRYRALCAQSYKWCKGIATDGIAASSSGS